MQSVWKEMRAGWRDARWSLHFGLLLLPTVLVALLIAYGIEGRVSTPPSAVAWCLIVPAALLSFVVAGLLDGPHGQIGRSIWRLAYYLMLFVIYRRAIQHEGEEQRIRFQFGPYGVSVTLTATIESVPVEDQEQATASRTRTIRDERWYRTGDSSGRALLPS